ncbi:two component transcriptional regulator, LuxR family [Faunimonas pinastri]|uniref:Two component transcriptional regulator, LuxR family n=1 Tax=Faunimonas pinastri TaxID=1855383 RepID=A0A1H9NAC2_9HYPH|nr:response regulator [Faunimonas pinastri]SER32894.1 two component transcriptional regulator, LuxR family [Faunimonas pinastri]
MVGDPGSARDMVLVVDDSPDTLRFLTDALEQSGCTVLVSIGGEQALALVEEITPDVILMDAVMPGLDGFETCRRLKSMGALAHVPVIFMTGLSETEHIVRGLEAGGVDYVTKPIVLDELFARIRVHLGNARAAQSARMALDSAGRFLFAANRAGRIQWSTPQALKLLASFLPPDGADMLLDGVPGDWIRQLPATGSAADLTVSESGPQLQFSLIGSVGPDELLIRLTRLDSADEQASLRRSLPVTAREAEVLLWIARGKSNRDIAEILGLSPRTVNKHLEQIFEKLGVENRASAAVVAMKAIAGG